MKTGVISYSHTGNTGAMARSLAAVLKAEHIAITEAGRRNMGTILLDVVLNRTPRVRFPLEEVERFDLVLDEDGANDLSILAKRKCAWIRG